MKFIFVSGLMESRDSKYENAYSLGFFIFFYFNSFCLMRRTVEAAVTAFCNDAHHL